MLISEMTIIDLFKLNIENNLNKIDFPFDGK